MTSSNGNIFRITGPLRGEFTGRRWIPHTKAGDAELWCFLWSAPELCKQWWFETLSRHYDVIVMGDLSLTGPTFTPFIEVYSKIIVSLQVLTVWIPFLLTAACRHCNFNGVWGHCDRSTWTKFARFIAHNDGNWYGISHSLTILVCEMTLIWAHFIH